MIIANTAAELQNVIHLAQLMTSLQTSDCVENFAAIMKTCGYEDGAEINSVENAAITINKDGKLQLVVDFKFDNDHDKEADGTFYVTVDAGKVTGDY